MQDDFDVTEVGSPAPSGAEGPVFSPPIFGGDWLTAFAERFFSDGLDGFWMTLLGWWQAFAFASLMFSGILLYGIIYSKIRYSQIMGDVMARLKADEEAWQRAKRELPEHARWRQVLAHAQSDNPNDWRLAIIEADIMLEEVLDAAGFPGRTIGDKLKTANRGTFRSLDDAWQAHKTRNDIAHQGGEFILTKRLANEAIARYERVFQEFGAL